MLNSRGKDASKSLAAPSHNFFLSAQAVHIWSVKLTDELFSAVELVSYINHIENERAKKFRFETDRKKFVACRTVLRTILGHYLNASPQAIQFSYTRYGKPYVEFPNSNSFLAFNLSHAADLGLFAFRWNNRIGIDAENVRDDFDYVGIISRLFSTSEQDRLFELPEAERVHAFFSMWVQTEAYAKALGIGLIKPISQLTLPAIIDTPPIETMENSLSFIQTKEWWICNFSLLPNFVASVVTDSNVEDVNYIKFCQTYLQ